MLQRSRFYTVLRCRWGFGLKDSIEPLPLSHEELGCPLVIFHGHLPGREEAADGGEPVLGALLQLEIGVDVVRLRPDIVRRTGILIFFESQGIEIILMMVWNIVIPCLRQSVLSPSATAKLQKVAASLSGGNAVLQQHCRIHRQLVHGHGSDDKSVLVKVIAEHAEVLQATGRRHTGIFIQAKATHGSDNSVSFRRRLFIGLLSSDWALHGFALELRLGLAPPW